MPKEYAVRVSGLVVFCFAACLNFFSQGYPPSQSPSEKPRVFVTDSESWEMSGSGGGSNGNWGAHTHGGARPQTAEIIKTFGERCPQVMVNNKQDLADYIVLLDHEGGKGALRHKNKVAVFQKESGDVVVSHSTLSLGGSVQDACEGIAKDWTAHGPQMRAAALKSVTPAAPSAPAAPETAQGGNSPVPRVSVASTPDGADIEVDGSFVGNTPSIIELSPGEHTVVVKKPGYQQWQRKLKVTGGEIKLNANLQQ